MLRTVIPYDYYSSPRHFSIANEGRVFGFFVFIYQKYTYNMNTDNVYYDTITEEEDLKWKIE